MPPGEHAVYEIRFLTRVQPGPVVTELTFQGGLEATLLGEHPDYDLLRLEAEESLERQLPVGLILDPKGRVLEIGHSHESGVHRVEDDEDGKRLAICFWAFCAVCYLTRDHPDFERIRKTLEEARAADTPVIFANETWPIEGETETWQKILDVRPVPVGTPAPIVGKDDPLKKAPFDQTDVSRGRLGELGVTLEDRPGGTGWRRG